LRLRLKPPGRAYRSASHGTEIFSFGPVGHGAKVFSFRSSWGWLYGRSRLGILLLLLNLLGWQLTWLVMLIFWSLLLLLMRRWCRWLALLLFPGPSLQS